MGEFKGTQKTGSNWAINLNNHTKQVLIENICIIDEPWDTPGVKEDAYLIAAAPDLLAALEKLMEVYQDKGHLLDFDVNIARVAIKKALNEN